MTGCWGLSPFAPFSYSFTVFQLALHIGMKCSSNWISKIIFHRWSSSNATAQPDSQTSHSIRFSPGSQFETMEWEQYSCESLTYLLCLVILLIGSRACKSVILQSARVRWRKKCAITWEFSSQGSRDCLVLAQCSTFSKVLCQWRSF